MSDMLQGLAGSTKTLVSSQMFVYRIAAGFCSAHAVEQPSTANTSKAHVEAVAASTQASWLCHTLGEGTHQREGRLAGPCQAPAAALACAGEPCALKRWAEWGGHA